MKPSSPHGPGRKPKWKACGAKTRQKNPDGTVKRCTKEGSGAGGRCKFHGGRSLTGADHPRFTNGARSKYLPAGILERAQEGMADRELMRIRQDVALAEALLTGHTMALKANRMPTEKQERRILNLVEHRRKLIESEAKRLVSLQQMVTLAQFLATMKVVADLIREFVPGESERKEIQRRLQKLLLTPRGEPDVVEGEEIPDVVPEPGL